MGAKGLLAGGAVAAVGDVAGASPAAAATAGTATPDWVNVTVAPYGADPTGAVDAATAFTDAIAQAAKTSHVVYVPAGTYTIGSTVTCTDVPIYFVGDGAWATTIQFSGTGDCFRVYDGSDYGSRKSFGGGFVGITLDGTHAKGAATGLHVGDLLQYELDLTVQNFTVAGSSGVHLDNNYYWTEQLFGRIYAQNCVSHVVFDWTTTTSPTTSSGSFERCDLDIYVNQQNGTFDGVVFQNGAFITNGSLKVRGNFGYSSAPVTSAALRFADGVVATSKYSSAAGIVASTIDVGVECASKAGMHTPQTIVFDTTDNTISDCSGALNFGAAGNTFSPSNNVKNVWNFFGSASGDSTLPGGWATYNTGFPTGISGHVSFRYLPSGNEVMVSWAFDIAANTALHNGDAIVTVSPKFAYNDNKIIPGNNAGANLTGNVYAPAYLTKDAVFKYCGPTYQGAGASWWYGQGIYSLSVG
jgi:hypothetical protein